MTNEPDPGSRQPDQDGELVFSPQELTQELAESSIRSYRDVKNLRANRGWSPPARPSGGAPTEKDPDWLTPETAAELDEALAFFGATRRGDQILWPRGQEDDLFYPEHQDKSNEDLRMIHWGNYKSPETGADIEPVSWSSRLKNWLSSRIRRS